jgi:hypothetical protein
LHVPMLTSSKFYIHFRSLYVHHFGTVEATGLKRMVLNVMEIYQVVQKLLERESTHAGR